MGAKSSIEEKDVSFSVRQTQTAVGVTWKVRNFSEIKELPRYKSPEFKFQNATWVLRLYPNGITEHKAGCVGLFLEQVPLLYSHFKWKCSTVDDDDKMLNTRVCEDGFSKYGKDFSEHESSWGWSEFLNRQDLLDDKKAKILTDDTLTIQCEIEIEEKELLKGIKNLADFTINSCECTLAKDFLKAYDRGQHSDVTLRIGDQKFAAHKVILSTRSPVFEAMFKNNMEEHLKHVVNIADMEPSTAKEMLLYIYTGKVRSLSVEKSFDLYEVADRYMLCELKEKCRDFIRCNLSVANVSDIAAKAHFHSDDALLNSIKDFLAANLKEVIKSDGWIALSKQNSSFYLQLLNNAIMKVDS